MHVPGWHDATETLRRQGKVRMLGVIEEQHPERARLFMQWKRMDWPLLVDSLDLLQVPYVPITLLVDTDGTARIAPRLDGPVDSVEELFPERPEAGAGGAEGAGETQRPAAVTPDLATLERAARDAGEADPWRALGRGQFLWGGAGQLTEAVAAYERAVELAPEDPGGWTHFRLGVAYRTRYDSPPRRPGDFQAAVGHWERALDIAPNNYIFRRRLQQYGPRLGKPYPFYDWVSTAQREIRSRGEEPVELAVRPRGAEIAHPAEAGQRAAEGAPEEPDPEGRIRRDPGKLVHVEATTVPGDVQPGEPVRMHLVLDPVDERKAHWNNEVEDLRVWLDVPEGWTVTDPLISTPNPPEPVSREVRHLEFELTAPEEPPGDGSAELDAYALYYVCEDVDGTCLYRRQDIPVEATLSGEGEPLGQ